MSLKKYKSTKMQKTPIIGENLLKLFNIKSYKYFDKGYFKEQPDMLGYYYMFKNLEEPKFCVIINTSGIPFKSDRLISNNITYIILSAASIEDFVNNLPDIYLDKILNIIDQSIDDKETRNLPYAYYMDETGKIKIDPIKASEVRRIYNRYFDVKSVRQVAAEMHKNFSYIREILHDNEAYMQMREKILPMTKLKEMNILLAQNIRGGAVKKISTREKMKMIQRNIKNRIKAQQVMQ